MAWIRANWLLTAIVAAVVAFLVFSYVSPSQANAADLGGNCCADLEERIAELEATAARKGNRKVSLRVYGQVNAALLRVDSGEYEDTRISQGAGDINSTYIGFAGQGTISADLTAGYVLEIDSQQYSLLGALESNDLATRQSYWWIKSESMGAVSVGKTSNATNNFDAITKANTAVASQPLSLQPLSNGQLAGADLPFDGGFRNVVRYDSPSLSGFVASASYGASGFSISDGETGDMWDVALRYAGEQGGVHVAAGIGYRVDDGQTIPLSLAGINLAVPTGAETETFLAAASALHLASGLFLTANYADQDWSNGPADGLSMQAYQIQGGIETKLVSAGKTTFFGEYGELDIDGLSDNPDLWGLGVVQAIDAVAMDLYLTYRSYGIESEDVDVISAGGRIKF